MIKTLDWLYRASGALAAVFLVLIGVTVMAQIIGRVFGVMVPSATNIAGYFLGATSFLGLAYSFRQGAHIRVTLLIERLPPPIRVAMNILALVIASAMIIYLTYFTALLVWGSWKFEEMSTGLIKIPIWIPQLGMLIGMFLFALALIEDLVLLLLGKKPNYERNTQDVLEGK